MNFLFKVTLGPASGLVSPSLKIFNGFFANSSRTQYLTKRMIARFHQSCSGLSNLAQVRSQGAGVMALRYDDVYEHKYVKDFRIRTTGCFEDSMKKTRADELFLYFPEYLNYEILNDPFDTREQFTKWAQEGNRFGAHNVEIGTRYESHRIFHGLNLPHRLFAHKNFVSTFALDSIMDEIAQIVEKNPDELKLKFLSTVSEQIANEVKSDRAKMIHSPFRTSHVRIFNRLDSFMSIFNDLTEDCELLFGTKFMIRWKELWVRFILGTAAEVAHNVSQMSKGLSIHPYFWSSVRPYSGAFILTGCVLYGNEAHVPPLDDPLEHEIHMVDIYDNDLLSFHKEQTQTHFNMINGLMKQGLSKERAILKWVRTRNQKCRDIEELVEAARDQQHAKCYHRIFQYQLDLFNYHIWSVHRYGWSVKA